MELLIMIKLILNICILILYTVVYSSSAEPFNGFEIGHCKDCGAVLVGAARVEPASIQSTSGGSLIITGSSGFSFTGRGSWEGTSPDNAWWFESATKALVNGFTTNKMGFVFSPISDEKHEGGYMGAGLPTDSTTPSFKFTGTGIADIHNSVELQISVPNVPSPVCDANSVCKLQIAEKQRIEFKVTPKINELSSKYPNLNPLYHQHVKFHFDATEYDTGCYSFAETVPARKLEKNDDYLDQLERISSRMPRATKCTQNYTKYNFISSVNRESIFISENQSPTGIGYVEYAFYAEGYYNALTKRCVNNIGCKIYHVSANGTAPPVTTNPQLTVKINGNGKGSVISLPAGISCSTGTCNYNFPTNTPITLTASSNNSTFTWDDPSCASQFQLTTDKTCTVIFSPQVVTPTKATLTVNVTKLQGTVLFDDVELTNCTDTSCSKEYTVAITDGVKLTPKPLDNYQFSKWSGDGCPKGDPNDNSITIKPVELGDSKTCTLSFESKPVTTELKACIDPIFPENVPITLSSKCSTGNNLKYRWTKMLLNQPEPQQLQLLSDRSSVELKEAGDYLIRLEVSDAAGSKSADSKQIKVSNLVANFYSWTNGEQIKLIPVPDDKDATYTWLINETLSEKGSILMKVLEGEVSNPITMLISKNQETANISKVVKTVSSIAPKSDFSIALISEKATPSFTLDASLSCDEDNRDNAGNNACDNTYLPLPANLDLNKGITKYSWTVNKSLLDFTKTQSLVAGNITCTTENQGKNLKCSHEDTVQESLESPIDISVSLGVQDDDVNRDGNNNPSTKDSVGRTIQLNRPVANFTVTQGVDKIITLTSTSQASSYSIAGTNQSTSISSYSWSVNGELQQQCNGNSCAIASLKNGEHTISLTVTDNYGLKSLVSKKPIFIGNPLGFEGKTSEGWSWNADGEQNKDNGQSKFFGGVCVSSSIEMCDFSTYTKQVSLAKVSNQTAFFRAALEINDTDLGKNASLLFVFGRDKSPFDGTTTDYFVNNTPPIIDLYADPKIWMAQLAPYQMIENQPTIKLEKNQVIFWNPPILALHSSNPPNPNDVLYVFFGYRIEEDGSEKGKIVYAPTPLILTITP